MNLDIAQTVAFILAAIALLGSPGPGIAALVAVGRSFRVERAMRFYLSMQLGLAIGAGLSAAGLAGLIHSVPGVELAVMFAATAYLIWLAWSIASAPVDESAIGYIETGGLTNKAAFFLGVANPKAYLAFASLFGSFALFTQNSEIADGAFKWAICVAIMLIVDLAWLVLGMALGRIGLSGRKARALNIFMGATILVACVMTWL